MTSQPLRAALLLDSWTAPAWAYEAIRRVKSEGQAQWSLVIIKWADAQHQNIAKRLWQSKHTALASLYVGLDQLVSAADRDPLAPCDLKSLLADIPQLEIDDLSSEADITQIKSQPLDVIVHFSFQPPQEKILTAAKFGMWSFNHGDISQPKFAGLREVIENQDVNHTALEILKEDSRENIILAETFTAVDRLSAARNRSNLYWPAASLLPRQLARLRQLGAEKFHTETVSKKNPSDSTSPNSQNGLTNFQLLPGLAGLGVRRLKQKLTKQFCRDQWFMLSHSHADSQTRIDRTKIQLGQFQAIIPPTDRFWADPHVVCHDGKPYVFFEEYLYETGRAHIAVMEFDDRGLWHSARPVLVRPYHLSYPFLFNWQGELYMIPETSANRTLEVYRCVEFPDRWSLHKTLMHNVNAYDATLVEYAGHWWMFVTIAENNGGSSWDELFLFHADHPLSDHWLPHPCNPIVSDVRRARPAGPIFVENGRLYRPAQDCSRTYGYGIRLHRIDELSPTKYSETEVNHIEPLPGHGWLATHTLSFAGGLTMIDAQRRRFKFSRSSDLRPRKTAEMQRREEQENTKSEARNSK